MNTITTLPWADQAQAELTDVEWNWRQMDESDGRYQEPDALKHVALGKRDLEAEAGRLRAELAVASFIEEFYTTRRIDVGTTLIARADTRSWQDATFTRKAFFAFVQNEVDRLARRGVTVRWGPPTSLAGQRPGEWWIELEGVHFLHDREQDRHTYRFHVVENEVNAWRLL